MSEGITVIKATKKPVTIEAIRWSGSIGSSKAVLTFIGEKPDLRSTVAHENFYQYWDGREVMPIKTLESDGETQVANIGDYIIKGVQGEFYPCKPDIFHATYNVE